MDDRNHVVMDLLLTSPCAAWAGLARPVLEEGFAVCHQQLLAL